MTEGLPDTLLPTSELIADAIKRLSARDSPRSTAEPTSDGDTAEEHPDRQRQKPKAKKTDDDGYSAEYYYYYSEDEPPQDTENEDLDVRIDQPFSDIVEGVSPTPTFAMTAAKNAAAVPKDASPPRRRKREEEMEVTYTDEQLQDALDQYKKNKTLPPFLMRNAVLDYLRRQSVAHIIAEEYDAARNVDILVNDLIQAGLRDVGGFKTEEEAKSLETRIERAQQRKSSSNQHYEERIALLQEQEQKKMEKLLEYQEYERQQFEADCQKPEFLQKFSKPSPQLLQVRRVQKKMALAHEFDQAKLMKAQAERLQREETQKGQQRAMETIRALYEQLLTKQQQQLWCTQTNAERKLQLLRDEMAKEKEVNGYVTRRLESQLKETRTRKSGLPALRTSGTNMPQSKMARTQLLKYKTDPEIKQLDIKLTNIKSVMTMKPPGRPVSLLAKTK